MQENAFFANKSNLNFQIYQSGIVMVQIVEHCEVGLCAGPLTSSFGIDPFASSSLYKHCVWSFQNNCHNTGDIVSFLNRV